MWGALEKSDFKVRGSWGGGDSMDSGPKEEHYGASFLQGVSSSTPVLQEQTRGLGS